jgi:hypothetical protein
LGRAAWRSCVSSAASVSFARPELLLQHRV